MSMRDKREVKKAESSKRRHSKWSVAACAAIVVGLTIAAFLSFSQSEPWGLPAIPHRPRPTTLAPELFSGRVAKVYRIAQEAPELLEQMPCYCGCYMRDHHRNNLDCYTDRHGVG